MKREMCSTKASGRTAEAGSHPVSLRTMYAEAMREVMADPRKAIAEHEPWLAALLCPLASTMHPKR